MEDRKVGLRLDLAPLPAAPTPAVDDAGSRARRILARQGRSRGPLARAGRAVATGATSIVSALIGGLVRSFVLVVVVPTLVAAVYLGGVASRQYMAESRFVVRGNTERNPGAASGGNVFSSMMAGLAGSSQDSYVIADHIRSWNMVDRLKSTIGFDDIYARPGVDAVARLDRTGTKEDMLTYWRRMSRVSVENFSGIVTLRVWAFTPEDALRISKEVIRESEELANTITQRGRDDAMRFARSEVERAEQRVARALIKLKQVKDANGIVDPETQIKDQLTVLTELKAARTEIEVRIRTTGRTLKPDSPVMRDLVGQKRALDSQITELEAQLTRVRANRRPDPSLGEAPTRPVVVATDALREFEEVEVERQFAEKAYDIAQAALDVARQQANAQQIFVSVFAPPTLPQDASYPRPFGLSLVVFGCAFSVWLIGALITAAVNDHRL